MTILADLVKLALKQDLKTGKLLAAFDFLQVHKYQV